MSADADHPLVQFASRYSNPTQDYLNAYMALARLDALIEDLKGVVDLLEAMTPENKRWAPWFGAEAFSFYSVGFVTCLEWHAKSRLMDLLSFSPSSLKIDDVKGTVNDKLIVQMAARQASVAQLVGAALRITSDRKYFTVVDRVFESLEFPFRAREWLLGEAEDAIACWIRKEELATVEELFRFRHQLVHEIGIETMGHPNVRDAWTPSQSMEVGAVVKSVVRGIEAAFTHFAPPLFPNLISEEEYPISKIRTLKAEFLKLDEQVDADVVNTDWQHSETVELWQKARASFADYIEAEELFIERAGMLHWRYFDARSPLKMQIFQYRINFLTEIRSHFARAESDNPDSE